jgi:uncharacterized repeat protein (TIGR03803 family)
VSCSRVANPLPPPAESIAGGASALNKSYKLLYTFTGYPSASGPTGIIALKGLLYGTTTTGGANTFGTVFVRGLSGNVRLLYSFRGGTSDGSEPEGNLVAFGGRLYGTTEYGGANGDGTVFEISPSGQERVLHSFMGGTDGANPLLAGLLVVNGTLYGTTNAGGDPSCHYQDIVGCGTIFAVSTSGKERVVYRFEGKPDGACPSGSLIEVGAELYGTTNFGGRYNDGSVFDVTSSGTERTLYSFKGYPDGIMPYAGVIALGGNFYGTTLLGGAFQGAGTVFELTPSGTESVLHSFKGSPDGALPYAALTATGGVLYGTTEDGGASDRLCVGQGIVGCGTVFAITTAGKESVLYKFKGLKDGRNPVSAVVAGNGLLYGTTIAGGKTNNGTIFQLAP